MIRLGKSEGGSVNVHWIISAYLRGPVMMAYSWPCGKIVILSEMSQTSSFLSAAPPLSTTEIGPFPPRRKSAAKVATVRFYNLRRVRADLSPSSELAEPREKR